MTSEFFNKLKQCVTVAVEDVSCFVFILVMLFGMSSWIVVNGVWTELPLLVNILPESWKLPSYLVILVQLANIGPFAYTVANRIAPHRVKEWPVIYLILITGCICCLLLVFFWDKTSSVTGSQHSTSLLILTTVLALVDCTSTVVYLPYLAYLKSQYVIALYIGEGLSGLVPGTLGLIQGFAQNSSQCVKNATNISASSTQFLTSALEDNVSPTFTVEAFFFSLFVLCLVSLVAFTAIHFLPYAKCAHKESSHTKSTTSQPLLTQTDSTSFDEIQPEDDAAQNDTVEFSGNHHRRNYGSSDETANTSSKYPAREIDVVLLTGETTTLTKRKLLFVLILIAWISCLTNSLLPGFQTYACLPYGANAYHLVVRLSMFVNPLASLFALFVHTSSLLWLLGWIGLATSFAAYHISLAALSPSPPLQGQTVGVFLVVFTGVCFTSLFSYTRVLLVSYVQKRGTRTSMLWCGVAIQTGAAVGAIISFLVVNVFHLLHSC